jgi:acetyltransferase-like isoleucine patch superfamily enzyme
MAFIKKKEKLMRIEFIQEIINKIRSLKKEKIQGKGNKVTLKGSKLTIKGNNNLIQSESNYPNVRILIYGNNNRLIVEKDVQLLCGSIIMGIDDCPVNNCTVHIGKNTTSNGFDILLLEHNSSVIIGEDCMFSSNITISCSDTHSILDLDNNLTNLGKFIKLGNHVWCGQGVRIGKNVEIKDNSIIGWGSIVTKKFDKPNVIIAGIPAQIVKENINWDRRRPEQYLAEEGIIKEKATL